MATAFTSMSEPGVRAVMSRRIASTGSRQVPWMSAAGVHSAWPGGRDQKPCSACSQIGRLPTHCSSASRLRPLTMCTSVSGRVASARRSRISAASGRASSGVAVNGTSVPS